VRFSANKLFHTVVKTYTATETVQDRDIVTLD